MKHPIINNVSVPRRRTGVIRNKPDRDLLCVLAAVLLGDDFGAVMLPAAFLDAFGSTPDIDLTTANDFEFFFFHQHVQLVKR